MACWLVVRAARGRVVRRCALVAGAFFAAAVHTHLFLVVFAPLVAVLYIAALPADGRTKGRAQRPGGGDWWSLAALR